jgi:hypothetical protein
MSSLSFMDMTQVVVYQSVHDQLWCKNGTEMRASNAALFGGSQDPIRTDITASKSCAKMVHSKERLDLTLTSALATASRKTHFLMYPQELAHASHFSQLAASLTASKYFISQLSASARASATAWSRVFGTHVFTKDAVANANTEAVSLATSTSEMVLPHMRSAVLAAARTETCEKAFHSFF